MKNYVIITLVFSCLLLGCGKNESENNSESEPENNSEIPVIPNYRIDDVWNYRIDDVLYGKDSKRKYVFHQGRLYAEYKYDNLNRISRINYGVDIYAYEIYQYNTEGQLETISRYDVYLENPPVLRQTVIYSYDAEGNKVKELYEWENSNSEMQTRYFLYQYSSGKLTKQEHYEGNQQTYYIVYEYNGDILVMEKFYVPGEKDFDTTEHFYEANLLVYSIIYHKDPKSGFVSDVRRYYDQNDNLIKVVGNHPGLSSLAGATAFLTTTEYEYE